MKLNNRFIIAWWLVLQISFLSLIYSRFNLITSDDIMAFDYLIVVLFFIIAFLPFFSEMSMFGLKFKKEISAIESSVNEVKALITNNNNSNHIYFSPSTNNLTQDQQEQIKKTLHVTKKDSSEIPDIFLSNDNIVVKLFAIRFAIDKELKRISVIHLNEPNKNSMRNIVRILENLEIIDSLVANALLDIYSITSQAIHANEVTENQIEFALAVGPTIVEKLKSLE